MKEKQDNHPTLTPPNEWVSVEERLPDEELKRFKELFLWENAVEVLVMIQGAYTATTLYWDGERFYDEARSYKVTHWMPLPAPPGKDNNVPTKAQNEPLTSDELLKMDGEPVYVVFRPDGSGERSQSWALVNVDEKYGEVYLVDSIPGASCYYDEIWANLEGIYRRPPERQEDT